MTTNFLNNRIRTLKFSLSWRFPPIKTLFLDGFPLCPQGLTKWILISPAMEAFSALVLESTETSRLLGKAGKGQKEKERERDRERERERCRKSDPQ